MRLNGLFGRWKGTASINERKRNNMSSMMKQNRLFYVLGLMMILAMACSGKKDAADHDAGHEAEAAGDEWKEMDDFHTLMADAFHPYKESLDLAPAKEKATELATAAKKWEEAPIPNKVDTDKVKQALEQLATLAAEFPAVVQTGNDEAVAEALTTLHDKFHVIQDMWYGGDEHSHSH
jgi:hypothetical protein